MQIRPQSESAVLRYRADRRTMLWAFGLFPLVLLAPYATPHRAGWILPLALYVGLCASTLVHNHGHCPTFFRRRLNTLYSAYLGVFYGYPIFAWIPTHNQNHHQYVNGPGDATATWRYSNQNTWLVASTYSFVSAVWQQPGTARFLAGARSRHRAMYRRILVQAAVFAAAHAGLLALAVALHGWRTGAGAYICGFGASAAAGLWGSMFVNFIQHVHCDPSSEFDHSRNFVSRVGNFLLFNNGFHTAHHAQAGLHWSLLPRAHAAIAHRIDPALNEKSIFGFCVRAYLLGALDGRFRTRPIGRIPGLTAPARGALVASLPTSAP